MSKPTKTQARKTPKPTRKPVKRPVESKKIIVTPYRDPIFWRNLLFCFLFFSFAGHYIEMAWTALGNLVLGIPLATNILANPLEPYVIYGTGAILCILIVYPLSRKLNHNIFATFIVATLVCSALELISSVVMTMQYGYNPYWNYLDRPFNLGGHICLTNCLLFGVMATAFTRLIYEPFDRLLRKVPKPVFYSISALLLIAFATYYLPMWLA